MKKYNGTIEITPNLSLTNPTMDSQGIKTAYKEESETEIDFKYLEIYFTEPNKKGIHSRFWVIKEDMTESDFVAKHEVLSKFK